MASITIGVLALQGAFSEHIEHLRSAAASLSPTPTTTKSSATTKHPHTFNFLEVRTASTLEQCDALVIPGGESTTISLLAQRGNLLEPLRHFVKVLRKPTWGTCAGLILLAESATRTKKGGQELIGGLDVRVNRNFFGRQVESFEAGLQLPFLRQDEGVEGKVFRAVFIRAPVVEKVLKRRVGVQVEEAGRENTVVAPAKETEGEGGDEVEVLARLPPKAKTLPRIGEDKKTAEEVGEDGDIVAVRQGNCFGTSFHPELTRDNRIHRWWLGEVVRWVEEREVVKG